MTQAKNTARKGKRTLTFIEGQYNELRHRHPDALLLFRCGDWYKAINGDALTMSQALTLQVTDSVYGYEQCMFPHHMLDTYLPKLIRSGLRVAICDSIED